MKGAVAGAVALLVATGAEGREPAPLPPGWTHEHDDEGDEDYVRPPLMRGIYAHGFSGRLETQEGQTLCTGDAEAQAAFARRMGEHPREFWFYSTGRQGVLFTRETQIDTARACGAPVIRGYGVSRAFVADGLIHSVDVGEERGDLEDPATRAFTHSAGAFSAEFYPLHNLMSRPVLPRHGPFRRENRIVAGLPASCRMVGGLAWQTVCRAREPGPLQGMLLSALAGDDAGISFAMHLDLVRPDAALDGRLFELDRDWDAPD